MKHSHRSRGGTPRLGSYAQPKGHLSFCCYGARTKSFKVAQAFGFSSKLDLVMMMINYLNQAACMLALSLRCIARGLNKTAKVCTGLQKTTKDRLRDVTVNVTDVGNHLWQL